MVGYTLLMALSSNAINAAVYENLPFNFIRDTAPVASIASIPLIMEVHPAFSAKTLPEFIAYAKVNPGKLAWASPGVGTPAGHVCGELFKMMAGLNMIYVPYRGGGAGDGRPTERSATNVLFGAMTSSLEYVKAGSLRALAVTTATCSEASARNLDCKRFRTWLRDKSMKRGRCKRAKGYSRGNRRQAEQGNQRRTGDSARSRRGSPTWARQWFSGLPPISAT